jgi:hypothetical protein
LRAETQYAFATLSIHSVYEIGSATLRDEFGKKDVTVVLAGLLMVSYLHFNFFDSFEHRVVLSWMAMNSIRSSFDVTVLFTGSKYHPWLNKFGSLLLMIALMGPGFANLVATQVPSIVELIYGAAVALFHPIVSESEPPEIVQQLQVCVRPGMKHAVFNMFPNRIFTTIGNAPAHEEPPPPMPAEPAPAPRPAPAPKAAEPASVPRPIPAPKAAEPAPVPKPVEPTTPFDHMDATPSQPPSPLKVSTGDLLEMNELNDMMSWESS